MTEVTKNITVDLSRKGNTRVVFARQNDKGSRVLNVTLTDGGKPYLVSSDTVAVINFLRPDEASASFAATVSKTGGVTHTLGLWALSVKGSVRCSVSLYGEGERKLTSSDFYIDVLDELCSDDGLSEDLDTSDLSAIYSSIAELGGRLTEDILALENKHDDELADLEHRVTNTESDIVALIASQNKDVNDLNGQLGETKEQLADLEHRVTNTESDIVALIVAQSKIKNQIGDIDAALDSIMELQGSLIDGGAV